MKFSESDSPDLIFDFHFKRSNPHETVFCFFFYDFALKVKMLCNLIKPISFKYYVLFMVTSNSTLFPGAIYSSIN